MRTYADVMAERDLKRQEVCVCVCVCVCACVCMAGGSFVICPSFLHTQLEIRGKIAEKKEAGQVGGVAAGGKPERKRRRWDQTSSDDATPSKKRSSWDQAEVSRRH